MKKAVCILLMMAVLLTCCVTGVSAKGKIADSLQAEMNVAGENETIRVIIWLYDLVDKEEVFRQAIKECGYVGGLPLNMTQEEVDAYHTVYNRIVFEQEAAAVNSFIEKLKLDAACINETYCLCINANLTKAQIEAAAAYSEVEGIYFDNEGLPVEPIEYSIDYHVQNELYKARLKEYYNLDDYSAIPPYTDGLMTYRELYYHHDRNGEIDWALIYCFCNYCSPMEVTAVIGNRVIHSSDWQTPFQTGYGVYDVKNDLFYDAKSLQAVQLDGFSMAIDEINLTAEMVKMEGLIGDLDRDDEISIIDVTLIQRCEVKIREYPEDDSFYVTDDFGKKERYYSDFNRDYERDVLDATCIQRYLVGLPYPIG